MNFARFYALLKRLPGAEKENLVMQFTGGRTSRLHLMTEHEYRSMCDGMERAANSDVRRMSRLLEMKRRRSAVLKRMQQIGVDTTDWNRVNAFLRQPRIAGKPLYELDGGELDALIPKLESIKKKMKENGQGV